KFVARGRAEARQPPEAGEQPRGTERDGAQPHLVAMQGAHLAAQIGYAVDQTIVERLTGRPEGAGEQLLLRPLEPRPAPLLDDADEDVVHVALKLLEPLHVLRALGLERIERALVLARGMHAPLDAVAADQLVEAEARRDDANGADDGGRIGVDLVAGERQEIAAGGRHVLAEDVDALAFLGR